jgi:hypothetical protein
VYSALGYRYNLQTWLSPQLEGQIDSSCVAAFRNIELAADKL